MSMRSAASCAQPLQESSGPRGARITRGPVSRSISVSVIATTFLSSRIIRRFVLRYDVGYDAGRHEFRQ